MNARTSRGAAFFEGSSGVKVRLGRMDELNRISGRLAGLANLHCAGETRMPAESLNPDFVRPSLTYGTDRQSLTQLHGCCVFVLGCHFAGVVA